MDLKKLSGKYEFKIFSEPFLDEADAIEQLSDFEALLIMRERTPITKNLIDNLNDLKYIITSGSRNKAIDLEAAHKRKIIVCGTEINFNPTCELTWALILGLSKNLKTEIDNMYQGYWQTTVGFELKGKIIGLIGLGRVGSQVAKIANAFGMQVILTRSGSRPPRTVRPAWAGSRRRRGSPDGLPEGCFPHRWPVRSAHHVPRARCR